MATQENIQHLIHVRNARLKEASEARDVDALMKWQAADTTFTDKVNGVAVSGWDAVRDHYAKIYLAMPTFRILQSEATGYTPEFVVGEFECEAVAGADMPQWGVKKGDALRMKAVSMFWWRWEGKGEWTGALDDEAVSGWKIYRERLYSMPG
ncbi:snoaL-like domain-containing protein [Pochonia chlamydosporia 170]|uniref:SnoaL-like domain-containing protein n=1 Tax=Pochonia chlamydosporia 170 TaxID=1380566 RepID=A0A179F201_METCM|nr:snoaL-like domain-containing protein [Pochonia chlamydosporia 170]OAQ59458.1 snoaL-like domain-containing protein [Pochonia chlamydosporia 170]